MYKARTLIALIDDSYNFDDACSQGSFSRIQQNTKSPKSDPLIKVVPNPADSRIDVKLGKELEGICHIEIFDALGGLVLSQEKNCKEKSFSFKTGQLKPGVYSVKVWATRYTSNVVKLIIAR